MAKIISYPLSVVFYLFFGLALVVFHGIQWLSLKTLGYRAHKKSVDILNWVLMRCLHIVGTRFKIENLATVPKNTPVIIVSNHQSLWDIPPIIWCLRKYHPKFISKKSLGKGIPSISFNLRHGGSVLIDRKDSDQSFSQIIGFAEYLKKNKFAGVIFPEGTRSRNGVPGPFKKKGLELLIENLPEAYVIPITINNSWKLQRWGNFPLGPGVTFKMKIHKALKIADFETQQLIAEIENNIVSEIY